MKRTHDTKWGAEGCRTGTCILLVVAKHGAITLKEIHIHTHNTTQQNNSKAEKKKALEFSYIYP